MDRLINTSRGKVALYLSASFGEEPVVAIVLYDDTGEGIFRGQWMQPGMAKGLTDWLSDGLGIPKEEAHGIAVEHVNTWKASDDGEDRKGLLRFTGIALIVLITLLISTAALIALIAWLAID